MSNFIVYIIGVIAGLGLGIVIIWAIQDNRKPKVIIHGRKVSQ